MSLAIAVGTLVGIGCIGMIRGLRSEAPTLETIATALDRWPDAGVAPDVPHDSPGPLRPPGLPGPLRPPGLPGSPIRIGSAAIVEFLNRSALTRGRWRSLDPCFAITGDSPDRIASKMLIIGGAGLLAPPSVWLASQIAGLTAVPFGVPVVVALVATPFGLVLPAVLLVSRARERRRHARVVVGCFVDLVVLNLAGGMGVESALLTAAQVSSDWMAGRISRSLLLAREGGRSSWVALRLLGEEIGVAELVELSATLQLAGTEGSRIRQSLSARAVALRRHEQADAESAANTTTERLFLPGALLLVGFLLFVGYPAFSRIVGGF